jgi:hypothetical protein
MSEPECCGECVNSSIYCPRWPHARISGDDSVLWCDKFPGYVDADKKPEDCNEGEKI